MAIVRLNAYCHCTWFGLYAIARTVQTFRTYLNVCEFILVVRSHLLAPVQSRHKHQEHVHVQLCIVKHASAACNVHTIRTYSACRHHWATFFKNKNIIISNNFAFYMVIVCLRTFWCIVIDVVSLSKRVTWSFCINSISFVNSAYTQRERAPPPPLSIQFVTCFLIQVLRLHATFSIHIRFSTFAGRLAHWIE